MNLGGNGILAPAHRNAPVYGVNVSGPNPKNGIHSFVNTWLSSYPTLDFRCMFAPILGTTYGYQATGLSAGLGVNQGLMIHGVARHPFTGAGY